MNSMANRNRCLKCGEPVGPGENYPPDAYAGRATRLHRECLVRVVRGSVGRQLGIVDPGRFPPPDGDPAGWTARESAAAAARLAVALDELAEADRPAALADAREKVLLLGPDVLFDWSPGVTMN